MLSHLIINTLLLIPERFCLSLEFVRRLGVIDDTNIDSSEIVVSWGPDDLIEVICVYEEDIFGCTGEVAL